MRDLLVEGVTLLRLLARPICGMLRLSMLSRLALRGPCLSPRGARRLRLGSRGIDMRRAFGSGVGLMKLLFGAVAVVGMLFAHGLFGFVCVLSVVDGLGTGAW